ncbi:PAS domain S-box-containing protein/diguanylate cyclase (GGDEF) domain-containing protein [Ensifer adhaerens]|nr:PAS domain S-box-containing protein/diguanylate cyclase (GGDEF) domain-containing protein [Ensifer adhaerens]
MAALNDNLAYRLMLTNTTVEKLADMVIWLDESGRYVFVNPAATKLLGYSAKELSRMHVWDVDPFFDQDRWQRHWQDVVEQKSFRLETVNVSKAGVEIPIEVTVNYVQFEGRAFNCSIVRDISERKRAEAELRGLTEKIYRLSVTDALTNLSNRRHFDLTLQNELDRHASSEKPLSLILLDIDAFKQFNDTYGHVQGDEALQSVALSLSQTVSRPTETLARYGGEEFAIILPETALDRATEWAERSRLKIESLAIAHSSSPAAQHVTASFGVVTFEDCRRMSPIDVLLAVDAALYEAKRLGRNRVVGRRCEGAESPSIGSREALGS